VDNINLRPDVATSLSGKKMKPAAFREKPDTKPEIQPFSEKETSIKDSISIGSPSIKSSKPKIPHASISLTDSARPLIEKDTTFLFYMNGQYGDLEQSIASSFLGLEEVGSNEHFNVVAQLGRAAQREAHPAGGFDRIDNDWSGVRRYYVVHSDVPHKKEMNFEQWNKISSKIPDNPLIHFTLGDYHAKKGEHLQAVREYDIAGELGYKKFLDSPYDPDVARWSEEFDGHLQTLRDAEAATNVFASPVAEYKGNVNMMHPQNLQDFISWGIKKYPAKHSVLVLMGHGGAWTGSMKMSPSEIGMAIQAGMHEANRATGRHDKLDAVIFNSCYMGNLESVDQLRDATDITVASQMSARADVFYHWPAVLGKVKTILSEGKEFLPRKLARDFVEFYKDVGETNSTRPPMVRRSKETYLTLVALDNANVQKITKAWKSLVKNWKELKVEDHIIFRNIKKSKNFPSLASSPDTRFDYGTLRDIGSIALNLMNDPDVPIKLKMDCRKIRKALREAIIAEQHTGFNMEGSSGLSIWAPTNAADISQMNDSYRERVPTFVQETGWADKLEESVKNVDGLKLQEFVQTMGSLGNIMKMFDMPGLTEKEKENLENRAQIMEKEAYQLRKELDLSIPRERPGPPELPHHFSND